MSSELNLILVLLFAVVAFTISASAGLGGSLILVPALSLLLGVEEGVAVSALLLACNNLVKLIAYCHTVPVKASLGVLVLTVLGSALGARLLVIASERLVQIAVIISLSSVFLLEQVKFDSLSQVSAGFAAFLAGATSGFSGTSGPLKALALRRLPLDWLHFVGAASAVSFAGDLMKTTVFAEDSLLDEVSWLVILINIPLMLLGTLAGRHLNRQIGERAFAGLFWVVMAGYTVRLIFS